MTKAKGNKASKPPVAPIDPIEVEPVAVKPIKPEQHKLDAPTKKKIALGVGLGVLLIAALVAAVVTLTTIYRTADRVETITTEQTTQDATTAKLEEKVAEHTHVWVPRYTPEHHDAEYQNVWHDPVYKSETTYHTICNDCQKTIDGIAAEHIADTGHSGYTVNVPITNDVLVTKGYNEPVLTQKEYDEQVLVGLFCTACGEYLTTDEAAEQGIALPATAEDGA